ncbi:SF1B family DNA helicase RecD2 [Nitrospira sp. Kam-Ns4a]
MASPDKARAGGDARMALQLAMPLDTLTPAEAWTHLTDETQFLDGLRRYLGSGLIRGLGPTLAERIVTQYGRQTLEILDHHPEALTAVTGIGSRTWPVIAAAWQRLRETALARILLLGFGLTLGAVERALGRWGPQAITRLAQDPYALMDLWGIGFERADRVAAVMGIRDTHPVRMEAALAATLTAATRQGHCFLPRTILVQQAAQLAAVAADAPTLALDAALARGRWVARDTQIYLPAIDAAERQVERQIAALLAQPLRSPWSGSLAPHLTAAQATAARQALTAPVSLLTGLPGTGKTTTVQAIVEAARARGEHVLLAAPTGKAAKRLADVTHAPAKTVHRLLEYHPDLGWQRRADRPLEADLVIVDESSMLDIELTAKLLEAIQPHRTRLLLVGDHHQLPSVGPGRVLRDCLEAAAIPATILTEIQRQAAQSGIVQVAHQVQRGHWPAPETWRWPDCEFVPATPETCAATVARLAATWATQGEVQVLTPMRKGPGGVQALNDALRAALNPTPPWTWRGWAAGDRVMQIRNNYQLDVMNGEVGTVCGRTDADELVVRYDDREVAYPIPALDELVPAWATTIHKAQGSEWPIVLIVLLRQHMIMLRRELLYTALTRARQRAILIGEPRAYALATRNDHEQHRYSGLFRRTATPSGTC